MPKVKENNETEAKVQEMCTLEHEQRIAQLTTLSEVGKALTSTHDIKEILSIVMEQIKDLIKPSNWAMLLVDEETDELYFEIIVGETAENLKGIRIDMGEGIAGWVAKEGTPELVVDVTKDERFSKRADMISNFTTNSVICVPLKTRGNCFGVIELINTVQDRSFNEDDLRLLTIVADYTAIAIENSRFFERIQELTIKDDLTSLYNSRHLHNTLKVEVARARRFQHPVSMIFFDLDHFKNINDVHGHLCGSKMLKETADLLLNHIRSIDLCFRYGGDEFVVVMPESTKDAAIFVAKKLRNAFKDNAFLKEEKVNAIMTASFGVASFPTDAKDENDLIKAADEAMYRVKNRSRDDVEEA